MKICLKTQAKQEQVVCETFTLTERLPARVQGPCELTCELQVEARSDYYLCTLNVNGIITVICQRCLGTFTYSYNNQSKLAVCHNDEIAETLMADYECIVVKHNEIDLIDIVTDELHLFLPEKHENLSDCDHEINALIGKDI